MSKSNWFCDYDDNNTDNKDSDNKKFDQKLSENTYLILLAVLQKSDSFIYFEYSIKYPDSVNIILKETEHKNEDENDPFSGQLYAISLKYETDFKSSFKAYINYQTYKVAS